MGNYNFANLWKQGPEKNTSQTQIINKNPLSISPSKAGKKIYYGSMLTGSGIKMMHYLHKDEKEYNKRNEKVIKEDNKSIINVDYKDKDEEDNKIKIKEAIENEEKVDNKNEVVQEILPDENKGNKNIINEGVEKEEKAERISKRPIRVLTKYIINYNNLIY